MDKESKHKERAQLEFIARITMPDGSVIEKTVVAEGGIPTLDDLDVHTIEGFRRSFDDYERAVLKARNEIWEEITQEYYNELKKRAGRKKKLVPSMSLTAKSACLWRRSQALPTPN